MEKLSRAVFCFLAVIVLCGVMQGVAYATSQAVVLVDGTGVFNLYQGAELAALQSVDAEVGYLGHDTLFPSVTEYAPTIRTTKFNALKGHDVALWYFENERALTKISSGQLEYISSKGKAGAVVGMGGDDDLLKSALGADETQNDMEQSGDDYSVYLYDATDDGVRDDNYTSVDSDATQGQAWSSILTWVEDQLYGIDESAGSNKEQTYDPWHNSVYTSKLSNVGSRGDVAVNIAVFKLETTSKTHDWYRVDLTVQGSTSTYYDSAFKVINYLYSLGDTLYATDGDAYGELWEHAPESTQIKTTVSYDLGLSLKGEVGKDPKTGAEASVGYSKSFDCTDVTIYDRSSHATDNCNWEARTRGPDWTLWPFNYKPSTTAQTSYTYKPSTIWRVEKGNALKLYTDADTMLATETYYLVFAQRALEIEAETGAIIEVKK